MYVSLANEKGASGSQDGIAGFIGFVGCSFTIPPLQKLSIARKSDDILRI
jgi:hypothetical protein